ncbi:hypothetical protein B0H11DRAFT_2265143 [Mycena galericulata]|nr:hypothetical protein B0H11DRAFT_2265143 [Mycena galericulata]
MATDTELTASARVYSDEEFAALIANLDLTEPSRPPPSPPPTSNPPIAHTPPPAYPAQPVAPHTPTPSGPMYYYESPNGSGYTPSWAHAASETQGVAGARVHAVQKREKKRGPKKKAYVVFLGRRVGVYRSWSQVEPLVSGVSNAIHRGYGTVEAAEAAYGYARSRHWIRVSDTWPASSSQQPLDVPTPSQFSDGSNPLHVDEELDDTWYVVYKGVIPGVYHSVLEALLNTVGLPNSLYESVVGRSAAFALFEGARADGHTGIVHPPSYNFP